MERMKKFFSVFLAMVLLLSAMPQVYASELNEVIEPVPLRNNPFYYVTEEDEDELLCDRTITEAEAKNQATVRKILQKAFRGLSAWNPAMGISLSTIVEIMDNHYGLGRSGRLKVYGHEKRIIAVSQPSGRRRVSQRFAVFTIELIGSDGSELLYKEYCLRVR